MARVVRGCSLVLSWGEGEGVVDKGGWGGWVLVASSDVMSAMLGEEAGGGAFVSCQGGIDRSSRLLFCLQKKKKKKKKNLQKNFWKKKKIPFGNVLASNSM